MHNGWLEAAAHLPVPQFILTTALLMTFSIGGFPVPITATLLLAGALAVGMPHGSIVFMLLLLTLALVMSGRDIATFLLSRSGSRWVQARLARRQHERRFSGAFVRSAIIPLPRQLPPLWLRRRGSATSRAQTLAAAQRLLARWGGPALALSRLSPIASPCDIAAGIAGMSLATFAPAVTVGRLFFVLLWLGAGALSGQAAQRGASLPQLASIISVVLILLIIIPAVLSRRWLLAEIQRPLLEETVS